MAFAATLRGASAVRPARTTTLIPPMRALWLALAGAIVDSRRRQAMRELRRHQPFGLLGSIRHIGLTRDELLPF